MSCRKVIIACFSDKYSWSLRTPLLFKLLSSFNCLYNLDLFSIALTGLQPLTLCVLAGRFCVGDKTFEIAQAASVIALVIEGEDNPVAFFACSPALANILVLGGSSVHACVHISHNHLSPNT